MTFTNTFLLSLGCLVFSNLFSALLYPFGSVCDFVGVSFGKFSLASSFPLWILLLVSFWKVSGERKKKTLKTMNGKKMRRLFTRSIRRMRRRKIRRWWWQIEEAKTTMIGQLMTKKHVKFGWDDNKDVNSAADGEDDGCHPSHLVILPAVYATCVLVFVVFTAFFLDKLRRTERANKKTFAFVSRDFRDINNLWGVKNAFLALLLSLSK